MTAASSAWGDLPDPARAPRSRVTHLGVLKRGMDVVGSLLLLVLLSPLLLAAVLAIRVSSPGAVLFRQERLGRGSRPFVMLKLRTMQEGCDVTPHRDYVRAMLVDQAPAVGGLYKLQADRRVTRVGAVLRRTSIDELPQLWNVLRGQMSLVGPRPVLAYEAELFPEWTRPRFDVRPGVTGLWQVSGRNRLSMLEGLALDVEYVEKRGLRADLAILARTVGTVLGRGAR